MSDYTEESLHKILKRDLIPIVLNLQSAIADKNNSNNKLLEEIRKFNDNFSKLRSELAVTKQVNTKLTKRIVPWNISAGQMPGILENNVLK